MQPVGLVVVCVHKEWVCRMNISVLISQVAVIIFFSLDSKTRGNQERLASTIRCHL